MRASGCGSKGLVRIGGGNLKSLVVLIVLGLSAFATLKARTAQVWLGGAGIGGVIVALWWVSGGLGDLAEDPASLQESFLATHSHRMEALRMVAPVGYALDWLLFFGDKAKVLTMGMVGVAGGGCRVGGGRKST